MNLKVFSKEMKRESFKRTYDSGTSCFVKMKLKNKNTKFSLCLCVSVVKIESEPEFQGIAEY